MTAEECRCYACRELKAMMTARFEKREELKKEIDRAKKEMAELEQKYGELFALRRTHCPGQAHEIQDVERKA